MPAVRKRWSEQYGKDPDQADVDRMFADYIPLQLECLKRYTTLIPGCAEAVNTLRQDFKLKIGSTTGRYSYCCQKCQRVHPFPSNSRAPINITISKHTHDGACTTEGELVIQYHHVGTIQCFSRAFSMTGQSPRLKKCVIVRKPCMKTFNKIGLLYMLREQN